jgi:hypothetical protein
MTRYVDLGAHVLAGICGRASICAVAGRQATIGGAFGLVDPARRNCLPGLHVRSPSAPFLYTAHLHGKNLGMFESNDDTPRELFFTCLI